MKKTSALELALMFVMAVAANAQDKRPIPSRSWDLGVDPDYAARTAKSFHTYERVRPSVYFLAYNKIAIVYPDGEGASSGDGGRIVFRQGRLYPESPLYRFHASIFDVGEGPGKATHLEWAAIRAEAQFMPVHGAGFVVRVDNRFLVYSENLQLLHEFDMPYYPNRSLPTGEPLLAEFYWGAVSPTGRSLAICHAWMRERIGTRIQVMWYDLKTFNEVASSEVSAEAKGCGPLRFAATDQTAFSGDYAVRPISPVWQRINLLCLNCDAPLPGGTVPGVYCLLDERHLLVLDRVLDFDGHEIYAIPQHPRHYSVEFGPPAVNVPRIVYGDDYEEGRKRNSMRVHVTDWKEGHELAVIQLVQDRRPELCDGGMCGGYLGVQDVAYVLSPDGKKLAVLNVNSLAIYDLP